MGFNRDDKRSGGGSGRGFGGGGRSFGGGSRFGGSRGGSARPTMHSATCGDCGNTCEVPFKPTGARPVFCSNCFKKEENGGDSRPSFDSRPSRSYSDRQDRPSFGGGDRQMHDAICAKCGDNCQVPFKPNDSKPVYCSNCFDKGAKGGQGSEQLDAINAKLDIIIKALGISTASVKAEKKSEPEVKEEVVVPKKEKTKAKAKTAPKKVSSKKKK